MASSLPVVSHMTNALPWHARMPGGERQSVKEGGFRDEEARRKREEDVDVLRQSLREAQILKKRSIGTSEGGLEQKGENKTNELTSDVVEFDLSGYKTNTYSIGEPPPFKFEYDGAYKFTILANDEVGCTPTFAPLLPSLPLTPSSAFAPSIVDAGPPRQGLALRQVQRDRDVVWPTQTAHKTKAHTRPCRRMHARNACTDQPIHTPTPTHPPTHPIPLSGRT